MTQKIRFGMKIDSAMKAQLEETAKRRGRTASQFVRAAVSLYMGLEDEELAWATKDAAKHGVTLDCAIGNLISEEMILQAAASHVWGAGTKAVDYYLHDSSGVMRGKRMRDWRLPGLIKVEQEQAKLPREERRGWRKMTRAEWEYEADND